VVDRKPFRFPGADGWGAGVWTEDRKALARLWACRSEVSTLASMQAETAKRDEAPTIAGVYLN
jgi:hypothetical protein